MIGVQNVKAYTTADLVTAGWTQVTTSLTDVNSKYFILVDAGNGYTSGMSVKHDANTNNSLYYQALGHPLSKNQMWKLSVNDGKYTIQALNDNCYVNANDAGYNRTVDASESTGKFTITPSDGVWHIVSASLTSPSNAMGPWDGTKTDGTVMNVAINKKTSIDDPGDIISLTPGFYLYSLPRPQDVTSTYITNPSFENDDVSTLPVVGDKSASGDSYRGWTLVQPTGWTVEEQGDNAFTRQLKDQDAYTDNGYGKVGTISNGDYCYYFRHKWWNKKIVIKQTLENLPAGKYTLSADIKAMKQGGSPKAYLSAGSAKSSDVTFVSGGEGLFTTTGWTTPQVSFNVNSISDVEIALNVEKDNTDNAMQIAFDNFILTYEPYANADDYVALNEAIEAAEDYQAGFEVGEYAPYTNKEAFEALAAAKAINPSAANTRREVQTATTLLIAATWTENTEKMNAIRWNKAEDYSSEGENKVPTGGFIGSDANSRISHNPTSNAGLGGLTQSMALMVVANTNATYGETEGYTLPLKATTVYEFKFKYAGWGECGIPTITILKGSETVKSVTLDAPAKTGNNNTDAWEAASVVFTTTEAGDYKVKFSTSDGRNAFGDLKLAAVAASATIGTTGWTTFASAYPLDLSKMSASTGTVKAYYASEVGGGNVTMTSTDKADVEAGTGLMLKGTPTATITIPVAASGTEIDGNMLKGCVSETVLEKNATSGYNNYVLVNNGGVAQFQSLSANGATIPAGKAYLQNGTYSAGARLTIILEDEVPTVINAIEAVEANGDALKDGKYLIGNKIVLVKNGVKYDANGKKLN